VLVGDADGVAEGVGLVCGVGSVGGGVGSVGVGVGSVGLGVGCVGVGVGSVGVGVGSVGVGVGSVGVLGVGVDAGVEAEASGVLELADGLDIAAANAVTCVRTS
jgi:hypothetical protein